MNNKSYRLGKIKKILLYLTIGLFSAGAILGIASVLFATGPTINQTIITVLIFGIVALFSMNAVSRIDTSNIYIKVLSIISFVSNFFWSIPAVLGVWGVFYTVLCIDQVKGRYFTGCPDGYDETINTISRIAITAFIVTVTTTIIANLLNIKNYSLSVQISKIAAILSSTYLGIYFLPILWIDESGRYIENTWRLTIVVSIIFVFSVVVTPVLVKLSKAR